MITLINITKGLEHVVVPTRFPDGTQQVWKLPEDVLDIGKMKIVWHYENDAEIITLLQLNTLLTSLDKYTATTIIPFLPYGRQDKYISNDTTFGLGTFVQLLGDMFRYTNFETFDAHNPKAIGRIVSKDVNNHVHEAIFSSECDLICFPDKGATNRGYELCGKPSFNLDKKRNQTTGVIEGLVCSLPLDLKDKNILIVDDLCDGGRTFIEAARLLKSMGAANVDLYITHGVFSAGIHVLTVGGIRHIYTTDSYKTKAKLTDAVTVFKLEV